MLKSGIVSKALNIIVLLSDVFHIGLVIGPRTTVLTCGAAEAQYSRPRTSQYSRPRTYNQANMKNIT